MALEIARIDVKPGMEEAFEAGVAQAVPLFRRAQGCRSMKVARSVETPSCYWLVVEWEAVEDHTVTFRNSEDFQEWRRLVGECFAGPPTVEHGTEAVGGF
ncbi:antibiotic biosynthesis monooxygenase family protein [Marinivivus vitaminiproducens]|uniref:antibiotic biosynthesis monooxygenase family protein n=1 Tax=Marinivivus vitaminiproducens TaxID=3035935 RepID=UPI0027AB886B|nr:antibiotic biosynthesis monooxygenase [Geminicoccaceae bacterium SCSIO 64248]